MPTFTSSSFRRFDYSSIALPSTTLRAVVKKDLGTLQDRQPIRASGIVTKSNSLLYSFVADNAQTLGIKLTDKTSTDSSGDRILKIKAVLLNDDGNKVPANAGRRADNILSFRADLAPGSYSVKIVSGSTKQVKYKLELFPGLV